MDLVVADFLKGSSMKKPDRVILVCCSFRQGKDPQGKCFKKGSAGLLGLLEEGLSDRNIENVMISSTGCMNVCDAGPVMAIYPEGYWYGNVTEESLEEILDALAENKAAEAYLIGDTTAA
jgi:(2Fe-2S) ferredoxin